MFGNYLSPFTSPKKQKPIINFNYPVPSINSDKNCSNTSVVRQKSPQHKISKNQTEFSNLNKQTFLSEKQLTINKYEGLSPVSMKNVQLNQDFSKAKNSQVSLNQKSNIQKQTKTQKIQKQNKIQVIYKNIQTCQICTKKKPSYLIKQTHKYCCSNCAIQQMKDGSEVIKLQENQKNIKKSDQKVEKIKTNEQRQKQLKILIENVSKEQQKLQQLKEKDLFFQSEQRIKQFFNSKKHVIRLHYQKLRETITKSIQKDLEQLQEKQDKMLIDFKQIFQSIQNNQTFLTQMKESLEKYTIERDDKEEKNKFNNFFMEKSDKLNTLQSQIQNNLISKIQKLKQKGEGFKFQMQQVEKKNQHLYDPLLYKLVKQKQAKKKPQRDPLFSFRY